MTSIPINEQLSLSLLPGTSVARIARLSRSETLRVLAEAIERARANASPLADWAERCLDLGNPDAKAEHDELFVSCRQFCEAAGVPAAERPSYSAFGRALSDMGLALERVPGGASVRRGCRLRRRRTLAPILDIEASVETFLRERCRIASQGGKARTRSLELHTAYCAWAAETDRDAIGIKRFAAQMEMLGLRRKHSNGIHWERVELLPASPRPLPGGERPSEPDGEGQ